MLCLGRKVNEVVCFPDLNIEVRVCGFHDGAVRLGVTAPRDVVILRKELLYPEQSGDQGRIPTVVTERLDRRMIPAG